MARHLVTGAGSGIGRALVESLRARGDEVIAVTRAEVDLSDPTAVSDWAHDLLAAGGVLDSLCHVAGVVELGSVAELTSDSWQRQLAVNLVAPAHLTSQLLPMVRAARGTVVFVNSTAGLAAHPGWSAYAASKWGLRALADALRVEESPHGVRVTSVFPGRTATPMQERVHQQEGAAYDPERWIRPESVAETILTVLDLPPDATLTEVTVRPR